MRDPHTKSNPTETNQSSDKMLTLLEVMSGQPAALRLQDIARLCDMHSSTALRFLTALQRRGYVAQDTDTGKYWLTFKLCALAQNVSAYFDIRSVALPSLRAVMQVFSESCNLAVENDGTVLYVEVVNCPDKTLMITQRIGSVAPMHCTGVGKLFLSEYPSDALDRLIAAKKLTRFTERTITEADALKEELRKAKESGYAFDNEECEVGARCVAAPIRDYTGKIKAGISVSGPAVRMTDAHIFAHLPVLLETAAHLSALMGFQAPAAKQ